MRMTNAFRPGVVALATCAAVLTTSACSSLPGGTIGVPTRGSVETISLASGIDVGVFVPRGWYARNVKGSSADPMPESPIYYVFDSEVIPESELPSEEEGLETMDSLPDAYPAGGGFNVSFDSRSSCTAAADSVAEELADFEDLPGFTSTAVPDGVGEDGVVVTGRMEKGWAVVYVSLLPLPDNRCQVLNLISQTTGDDPTAVEDLVVEVAENSTVD